MMTKEENEMLTSISPGAPCGELLRRYWQPAALSEELPPGGAPLALKLMGEELVLFRDDKGRLGLLGLHCSHRGADLSYGRVEDGGLRWLYHGWLYDIQGRCLEQPGEVAGARSHENIRHKAYPCQEMGGLIFAYLGPGEPPVLPAYEIFTVPDENRFACKVFCECNYLQGNEGNIDPVHLSFLHRILDEHLVSSDKAIVAARKLLLKAIRDLQEGREPLHVIRDPKGNCFPHMVVISQVIPSSANWREYAKKAEAGLGA